MLLAFFFVLTSSLGSQHPTVVIQPDSPIQRLHSSSPENNLPVRWGRDGHKMVCMIAWWEMKSTTRSAISTLLTENDAYPRFMESCLWADDVRGKEERFDRWSTSHYVNLPRGATSFDAERDCGEAFCVVEGIEESLQGLRNSSRTKVEHAEDLKFVSHFVGDIHQPMHAGYADDRGGNDTKITLFGKPSNMHGMWDYGLLEHTGRPWLDYASILYFQISDDDRTAWASTNPAVWTEESFSIVTASAYNLAGTDVGQAYYDQHIGILEKRIKQAGVRLADLLDTAFSD
ncbi:MAG: S1/P1 nuclease [Bacteroidetes bacterium]|nr:S1/P1 nuclease [Bacteroidota bacterium]